MMPSAATWMELQMITLSQIRERQIPYGITNMWNQKENDTNELIYKTEIDSQTQKTNLWLPKRVVGGREINQEFGINIYTLLHIKEVNNKDLQYSTGNCIQYLATSYSGKESEK